MEILAKIPKDFIYFLMTTLFALIIGLEQRRRHDKTHPVALFGTDRTYALIGILGFILYVISPENLLLFIIGEISLLILLAVFYIKKIEKVRLNLIFTIIVKHLIFGVFFYDVNLPILNFY